MESEPVELDEGSNSGDDPLQQGGSEPTPTPPPLPGEETVSIPPRGSGARLGFLLGVQPSPSSSRGTHGGGARDGLPPVAATGSGRKRGRTPVASSSDGDGPVQKNGKNAAGDKQAQKAKSPVGTSCGSQTPCESVNEISDDDDDPVVEVNTAARLATRRLTSDVWLEMTKKLVRGEWKGICNYCNKQLSAASRSGTTHLRDHLKICTQRVLKLKPKGGKSLSHFIDESWKLRSILMGFIYVPAPHTGDVIAEELHDTLMQWNLDEKLMTVTVDNCTRYPTLRKVARDVFAIPVTTVASESAFSTSGRIVNEHRSRLTSHMLQVLMCYQDWLRNKYKDAHMGEASFWTCLQDTQEEEDSCLTSM